MGELRAIKGEVASSPIGARQDGTSKLANKKRGAILRDSRHFSVGELGALECFLTAVESFRDEHPTMTVQAIIAFLLVALYEDEHSVTEYAKEAGVGQTVMTRHLLDLGSRMRKGEEGMGLVSQDFHPDDMRRRVTTLAPDGVTLARKLLRHLKQACVKLQDAD